MDDMDRWYSLSLGDGVTALMSAPEIEDRFRRAFDAANEPPTMAIFTRPESEDRLYCEVIAYFSPAAADVAQAFDARPCLKPERGGLRLLAGSEEAWSVLFAEHTK